MEHTQNIWDGQILYAGMDVHRKKCVISVRTKEVLLKTFVTNNNKEIVLRALLNNWPGATIKAVYEAGCFGYHLADFLIRNGIETIIVAGHTVPIAPGQFVKTDKIDSKRLALELAKGSLLGIYQPSKEELYDRGLIRKRKQHVKRRIQIMVQIKSDLLFYGIELKAYNTPYWSKRALAELKNLSSGKERYFKALLLCIEEYELVVKQVKEIERFLFELAESKKYKKKFDLLLTVPGIGKLTAITLLLEIGSIKRFSNAEKFISYLGLAPSEHSSGDVNRKGTLTGMGNSKLRAALVESAWTAIKKDPVLLNKFQRLSYKGSRCKAIVAVTKSLATRIRKVLIDEQPYVIGVVK